MKIEATTVQAHRFGTVRRKGYDPVEVDRVMDRLVATLQSYEHDTGLLEVRVQEADESIDAIRRTFVAAQRTKDEMISEGATRADQIVADAQRTAARRLEDAKTRIDSMHFERDQVVIEAHGQWERLMSEADEASFLMLLEAETARASAIGDRERIVHLSERAAKAKLSEASEAADELLLEAEAARASVLRDRQYVLEEARQAADDRIAAAAEEAERIANEIVGEASREELRISARLDHLRAAITEVETKIHDLAAIATPYTEEMADIIDLTEVDEEQPLTGSGRN